METEAERVRLTAEGGGGRKLDDFNPKSGAAVQREKTRNQKSNGKIKEIKTNTKY